MFLQGVHSIGNIFAACFLLMEVCFLMSSIDTQIETNDPFPNYEDVLFPTLLAMPHKLSLSKPEP